MEARPRRDRRRRGRSTVAVTAAVPELPGAAASRRRPSRAAVTFGYRGKHRRLDPYGLLLRAGFWYVVGHDHDHDEQRTYRVDRIERRRPDRAGGAFERPRASTSARRSQPTPRSSAPTAADGPLAARARRPARAPAASSASSAPTASSPPRRRLGRGRGALRQRAGVPVVGARLLDHAEVVGPPDVRDGRRRPGCEPSAGTADDLGGRRTAEERLSRLLVMLPWLMERGEVPLAEVARPLRDAPSRGAADLELAAMCGLPPFVDEMIDVFIDDETVFVGVPRLFTRPLRLTAPEGFALLAAARAAMELPGADESDPLGRGLAKLARRCRRRRSGAGSTRTARDGNPTSRPASWSTSTARSSPTSSPTMRPSVECGDRVLHAGPRRGHERTIMPRHVFVDAGHWYVVADDGRSGERRTFRIDRIDRRCRPATSPTGLRDVVPDSSSTPTSRWSGSRSGARRAVGDRAVPHTQVFEADAGRVGRGRAGRRQRSVARSAARTARPERAVVVRVRRPRPRQGARSRILARH